MSQTVHPAPPQAASSADEATRQRSLRRYERRARGYDSRCGPTWPIRERAIAALQLQPGQQVLDVACGTGLSLALLQRAVAGTDGCQGRVWGFDHSAAMLVQARERVAAAGWPQVALLETAAQHLQLPAPVDALLFHYTHDILRSPLALRSVLACARPGARVAIAGIKYFPAWLAPLNLWVYWKNRSYNGAPGELRQPWDRIAPLLDDWRFEPTQWGMGYLASGRLKGPREPLLQPESQP